MPTFPSSTGKCMYTYSGGGGGGGRVPGGRVGGATKAGGIPVGGCVGKR